jgi:hypothetical protein
VSLLIGTSITLLIALMRAGRILPESADVVLRPGAYLARAVQANDMGGALLAAMGDGIALGAVPLLLMRILHWRRTRTRSQTRAPLVDRRRSSREPLAAEVFVYGYLRDEPFAETTETLNVSESGGLITLSVRPALWQELMLVNPDTDEQMRCRVARSAASGDRAVTGVEFLDPSPTFWPAKVPAA